MTIIAIAVSAVVSGWSILLVISDERQRALANAQLTSQNAQAAAAEAAKPAAKGNESGKRKN